MTAEVRYVGDEVPAFVDSALVRAGGDAAGPLILGEVEATDVVD